MAGRQPIRSHSIDVLALAATIELPSVATMVANVRSSVAVWSRSLADRLAGPADTWCPICDLELELEAADRSCSAPNGDDES